MPPFSTSPPFFEKPPTAISMSPFAQKHFYRNSLRRTCKDRITLVDVSRTILPPRGKENPPLPSWIPTQPSPLLLVRRTSRNAPSTNRESASTNCKTKSYTTLEQSPRIRNRRRTTATETILPRATSLVPTLQHPSCLPFDRHPATSTSARSTSPVTSPRSNPLSSPNATRITLSEFPTHLLRSFIP